MISTYIIIFFIIILKHVLFVKSLLFKELGYTTVEFLNAGFDCEVIVLKTL